MASGLANPTEITHAGDSSGRLFVLEKGGRIRIVRDGRVLPTPFLDLTGKVTTSGERGLLGLAFHPQYATNRRFFVFYTRQDGALTIAMLNASGDPDIAEAASEQTVLAIPHPSFDNHNGGKLAFGPDGYLYIAAGDGGSGGDPSNNAQSIGSLLGKILRIDVSGPGPAYSIPPDNPFAFQPGARSEIYFYGLRNPWRFAFDRLTADLYIGDVGQNAVEEIDFVAAGTGGGLNFGWRVFEGTRCFNPSSNCSVPAHTGPILEYLRNEGASVTGGFVYRGTRSAALRGYYFFGDFVSSRVWAAIREGAEQRWTRYEVIAPGMLSGVSTFGEDEAGELYVASYSTGRIYAIEGPGPAFNPATRSEPGAACRLPASTPTANPLARTDSPRCHVWGQ